MSERLSAFGRYPNVKLYPTVKKPVADRLFDTCDLYFDINYGREILSAVKRAFLNNMLILAFEGTQHRRRYTADAHVFSDARDFVKTAATLTADRRLFNQHLALQRKEATAETVEVYQIIMSY